MWITVGKKKMDSGFIRTDILSCLDLIIMQTFAAMQSIKAAAWIMLTLNLLSALKKASGHSNTVEDF